MLKVIKGQSVKVAEKFKTETHDGTVSKIFRDHFEVTIPALGEGYVVRIMYDTLASKWGQFSLKDVSEASAPVEITDLLSEEEEDDEVMTRILAAMSPTVVKSI